MSDDLLEHLGDVVVVQLVDHLATITFADDEPKVTQQPQLVRDRRAVHADGGRDLVHRRRTGMQAREDPQPTRCCQSLHSVGRRAGIRAVTKQAIEIRVLSMGHPPHNS